MLINVAAPETLRERRVILITSGSRVKRRRNAFSVPSKIRSIYFSQVFLFLACVREEKRRSEFPDPEGFDHALRLGGDHKIPEGLAACRVSPWGISRGFYLDHMIDIEKAPVALDHYLQGERPS